MYGEIQFISNIYIFIIIGLCFSVACFSQPVSIPGQPRQLTKAEQIKDERNQCCVYDPKYSIKQRRNFYPISNSSHVVLISFSRPDSLISGNIVPVVNREIDNSRIVEEVYLSEAGIDSLTEILYDHRYKGEFYSIGKLMCYTPYNAIFFMDSNDNVFEYISLGFECYGHEKSSESVKEGDFCIEKIQMLRSFFTKQGIKYGVSIKGN